jgi:hypothetical protein
MVDQEYSGLMAAGEPAAELAARPPIERHVELRRAPSAVDTPLAEHVQNPQLDPVASVE